MAEIINGPWRPDPPSDTEPPETLVFDAEAVAEIALDNDATQCLQDALGHRVRNLIIIGETPDGELYFDSSLDTLPDVILMMRYGELHINNKLMTIKGGIG